MWILRNTRKKGKRKKNIVRSSSYMQQTTIYQVLCTVHRCFVIPKWLIDGIGIGLSTPFLEKMCEDLNGVVWNSVTQVMCDSMTWLKTRLRLLVINSFYESFVLRAEQRNISVIVSDTLRSFLCNGTRSPLPNISWKTPESKRKSNNC